MEDPFSVFPSLVIKKEPAGKAVPPNTAVTPPCGGWVYKARLFLGIDKIRKDHS